MNRQCRLLEWQLVQSFGLLCECVAEAEVPLSDAPAFVPDKGLHHRPFDFLSCEVSYHGVAQTVE